MPVGACRVSTPHYSPGLLIERSDSYTKVYSRAGLSLMWNRQDSLMVRRGVPGAGCPLPAGPGTPAHSPLPSLQLELDSKFRNHTCGLCGDFNGLQTYSEFLADGEGGSPRVPVLEV